jgi:hypothetical protein
MNRREKKGAPPAATALSVPGIRVVVAEPDLAPPDAPRAGDAAKAPAPGGSAQQRKRRAKFVF